MQRLPFPALVALLAMLPLAARATPTADQIVKQYDAIMGPETFAGVSTMTAHREDDSERTYKMRFLKSGADKFRMWFLDPAAVRGQEILRHGDNTWVYLPNLKRAVRLASRDSFQGGDFNNADVLRVNYESDYTATLAPDSEGVADSYLVLLKAKTPEAAYDRVKLWVRKNDFQPLKGEYYTLSGKMLRAAEFSDVRDFGHGLKRPAKIVMKNMLAVKRWSTMVTESMDIKAAAPMTRFVLDDLGR